MMERQQRAGRRRCWPDPDVATRGLVHRRRRHQPHHQQRPPLHRAQAARASAAPSAERDHRPAPAEASPPSRASRSTCSRCRTCRSTAASAAPSTSTRWRTPTPTSSRRGRRACWTKLRSLPELRDVASDQQTGGLQLSAHHRPRHGRAPGVTPQAIDDTLYDAFGQRQVSTIFTQLNQYRVILEVKPEFQQDPDALDQHLRDARQAGEPGAARRLHALRASRPRRSPISHQGQFPAVTSPSTWRPASSLGDAVRGHPRRRRSEIGLPAGVQRRLPGRGAGVPRVAGERAAPHPGRAHHRLHRAGRALRELHPPHHHPLHPALGRRGRAPRADAVPRTSSASSRSSASSCSSAS